MQGKEDMKASVKVMRSYDYCHFEVCLGNDDDMTLEQIDAMRKEAMRLADKAVEQYKVAKEDRSSIDGVEYRIERLAFEANQIKAKPESEWTPEEKAKVKRYENAVHWLNKRARYDYEDDYDMPEYDVDIEDNDDLSF
jgi:hypothetical protein